MSPGAINEWSVRRHLLALDQILAQLNQHIGQAPSVLDADLDERWIVERGLQLCTQCVLDIATHVCASAGRDAPDYTSAIDGLGELGVLSPDLTAKLRPLAGFRNALVHGYLRVDTARLHAVLNHHLDEVRDFVRSIEAHLGA